MPTYDYKCLKCGTLFEVVQKISAKPGAKCPKCGARAERQISGGAGLVFKGSGFYLTDYGRAGQTRKSDSESSTSSDASSSDKSGGDKSGGDKSGGEKSSAPEKSAEKKVSKPKKKAD